MAGAYYQDGASLRTMTNIYYQDGGTTRTITAAYYQDGANLRQWWPVGVQVNITDRTVIRAVITPATATAIYNLNSSGVAEANGSPIAGEWLVSGLNSDYEVRATAISGTPTGGSLGIWEVLSTSRTWSKQQVGIGTSSCTLLLEIRRVSDLVIIDTANITLQAEVSP